MKLCYLLGAAAKSVDHKDEKRYALKYHDRMVLI